MKNKSPQTNTAIGDRLRSWLIDKFDDVANSAKALDMSYQSLTQYLRGERIPGNSVKRRLESLGADVDYIMTGRTIVGQTLILSTAIGDRLRSWLLSKYEDTTKAAQAMKMSEQSLALYFRGVKTPDQYVKSILVELGADVDYIMTGRKPADVPPPENFALHKDIIILELFRRIATLEEKFEENAKDLKKIKEEQEATEIKQTNLKNISKSPKSGATPIV